MKRTTILSVLAVAIGGAAAAYGLSGGTDPRVAYRTAVLDRGPIISSVAATGVLNAVMMVEIGSQVSGQISDILVDYNSEVREGDLIARIDPAVFQTRVAQARAEVDVAAAAVMMQEAQRERAQADVENARAALAAAAAQTARAEVALAEAERDLERRTTLLQRGIVPSSDRDRAAAERDSARADVSAAKAQEEAQQAAIRAAEAQLRTSAAQVENARAQVRQREAALRAAEVDLAHTEIRSPVDGVIVSRDVSIGQTVAASLQAPKLFTIARNLAEMQVETSVDEADVGGVEVGQAVTFTVSSFPEAAFAGSVRQIRKAPQVEQSVVTYTVVVSADNPELRLLPGMTADVRIVVDAREDVLRVPNAALRFRPVDAPEEEVPPATPSRPGSAVASPLPADTGAAASGTPGRVWAVESDGTLRPVAVGLGITDGRVTELRSGDLAPGQRVVIGFDARPRPQGGGPRFGL